MADTYLEALKAEASHVEEYLAAAAKDAKKDLTDRLADVKAEIARVEGSVNAPVETADATTVTETPESPAV
jgi:tRNA isopentenyl-2-thiomethyl-A-37 hydroxylase MiaE